MIPPSHDHVILIGKNASNNQSEQYQYLSKIT